MPLFTNPFIKSLQALPASQVLLVEGRKRLTAGLLLQRAYALATHFSAAGLAPGQRVVLAMKPGIEFTEVFYALLLNSVLLAIIDPEMGRENYAAKFRQLAPHYVFADSRILVLAEYPFLKWLAGKKAKGLPPIPRIGNYTLYATGPRLPIQRKHLRLPARNTVVETIPESEPVNLQSDCLLTYTSGTLSEPKGVVHTYSSLHASITTLAALLVQNGDQAIATHLPHFALIGINAGVKVYLWPQHLSPRRKLRFIARHHITTLFGPPSDFMPFIRQLLPAGAQLPHYLKNIYLGSAPIYTSFLAKLEPVARETKLICFYGMTENLMTTWQDGKEKLAAGAAGDLVGQPFPGVQISIAPDGEILVNSPQLFNRYWEGEKQPGPHATGDLGRLDAAGRLLLLGRKKDMIIRRNFNIYPALYEPTIERIHGVERAVLLGRYSETKEDEELVLVIEGDARLRTQKVMVQLVSGPYSIDREALPDEILFCPLPLAGRQQKIDKRQLAKDLFGT